MIYSSFRHNCQTVVKVNIYDVKHLFGTPEQTIVQVFSLNPKLVIWKFICKCYKSFHFYLQTIFRKINKKFVSDVVWMLNQLISVKVFAKFYRIFRLLYVNVLVEPFSVFGSHDASTQTVEPQVSTSHGILCFVTCYNTFQCFCIVVDFI